MNSGSCGASGTCGASTVRVSTVSTAAATGAVSVSAAGAMELPNRTLPPYRSLWPSRRGAVSGAVAAKVSAAVAGMLARSGAAGAASTPSMTMSADMISPVWAAKPCCTEGWPVEPWWMVARVPSAPSDKSVARTAFSRASPMDWSPMLDRTVRSSRACWAFWFGFSVAVVSLTAFSSDMVCSRPKKIPAAMRSGIIRFIMTRIRLGFQAYSNQFNAYGRVVSVPSQAWRRPCPWPWTSDRREPPDPVPRACAARRAGGRPPRIPGRRRRPSCVFRCRP